MSGHDAIQNSWFSYVSLETGFPNSIRCAAYDCWSMAVNQHAKLIKESGKSTLEGVLNFV
ncbi:MAG: hypothetical protein FJY19_07860 [Bacteroidetes bacterium]|nr:hypothetical protein [Bacteroidota bacterium]